MDRKINGHTVDFIKRQAKSIKKNQGITHLQALNQAAVLAGFSCWKNFLNMAQPVSDGVQVSKRDRSTLQPPGQSREDSNYIISPYRKLLIEATNKIIEGKHISLLPEEGFFDRGHVFADIFGFSSVVIWREIGWDEIEISVWWKYDHSRHPQAELTGNQREEFRSSRPLANDSEYKKFVGVVISGWLERKKGKYLMGEGDKGIIRHYVRRGEKLELEKAAPTVPLGFEIEGKFRI